MAKTFRCSIVTPSRAVFDGEVSYVSFPAWDGQQGVMDGQSPLLAKLGVGTLRLDDAAGGSQWFLIDGGFAQVQNGDLTLLTESAVAAGNVNRSEAQAELAEANARVTQTGEDRQRVERDQQRAMAKLRLTEHSGR